MYKSLHCTPVTISEGFCKSANMLWEKTLKPGLINLGWREDDVSSNPKSILIALPMNGQYIPVLQVGWVDTDSKFYARNEKIYGSCALKVDVYLRELKSKCSKEFIEAVAGKFYTLGWRGRGLGKFIGSRTLTYEEYGRWHGVMKHTSIKKEDLVCVLDIIKSIEIDT